MGLTLDESTDKDDTVQLEGFSVIAEKKLLNEMSGVEIDYREGPYGGGFVVRPGAKGESNCGGCSC